ncbi:TetR/AcrR family transcriptional regulator C-terminal domain-containing protein [Micromonospora sp. NPDC047740]|uniref:TetR/AcrR family transcriptional regulator C-terminal domain-containing protein n=1 Tax=Micromonospora sp. NPDC047740 TaxID=3364254 RepID=UPI0037102C9D
MQQVGQGPPGHHGARLEHIARENRALYLRHPWLLQVATTRPPLGPQVIGFPLAARVGTTAGEEYQAAGDPARAFEFGLARILDGIEVLIRNRPAGRVGATGQVTGG